jgi:hypothetical protein
VVEVCRASEEVGGGDAVNAVPVKMSTTLV